jgi:hypothetical protein
MARNNKFWMRCSASVGARRFPRLPRPVTVRVGITSLSRIRDVKFTETGLNFLYRVL